MYAPGRFLYLPNFFNMRNEFMTNNAYANDLGNHNMKKLALFVIEFGRLQLISYAAFGKFHYLRTH